MDCHKFRVGQVVGFDPLRRGHLLDPDRLYKILRLLPREGGVFAYRVKTITEAGDRVAKEDELTLCR
jgi:hypothetical protein